MNQSDLPPQNPAGEFTPLESYDERVRADSIQTIREAAARLRDAVAGLTDAQLDTKYRNWTIRQITHHIGDSHLHSIIRFKWTLSEEHPTIKAYEEGDWVELADSREGPVAPALALLDGLHQKWCQVLESMTPEQYERQFRHPQSQEDVSLWTALQNYAWHSKHHTAQILWVRNQNGW